MAGIWERVRKAQSETDRRINVSLLETELTGVALGVRTRAEAKANIETELGLSLSAAENTDLQNMADNFETGTVQDRLVYAHKVKFCLNGAELGLIDETEFRTTLSI